MGGRSPAQDSAWRRIKSFTPSRIDAQNAIHLCRPSIQKAREDFGIDFEVGLKMTSSMGGGMGRLREVCGAVSSMFLLVGLKRGYIENNNDEIKANHYKLIQDLADEFKNEFGSILCRNLLGEDRGSYVPDKRTEEYYKTRPCAEFIKYAAKLTEKIINEKAPN